MRQSGTVGQGAARPAEDTFTMPPSWRAKAHPRRGGRTKDVALRPDALEVVRALVADPRGEPMIAHERTEPAIVDAVARYRAGVAEPLGAAASVVAVSRDRAAHPVVIEGWIQEHGLAFAAAAVLEMADLAAVHVIGARGEWLAAARRPGAVLRHGERDGTRALAS